MTKFEELPVEVERVAKVVVDAAFKARKILGIDCRSLAMRRACDQEWRQANHTVNSVCFGDSVVR